MQELALKIIKPFAGALLILALLFTARQIGYSAGLADAKLDVQKADIASLNKSIGDLRVATKDANEANFRIHKTISDRVIADRKTTQDIRHALTSTSYLRNDCLFDSGIMQQLSEAADRADQAAASGFNSAMPTGSAPN